MASYSYTLDSYPYLGYTWTAPDIWHEGDSISITITTSYMEDVFHANWDPWHVTPWEPPLSCDVVYAYRWGGGDATAIDLHLDGNTILCTIGPGTGGLGFSIGIADSTGLHDGRHYLSPNIGGGVVSSGGDIPATPITLEVIDVMEMLDSVSLLLGNPENIEIQVGDAFPGWTDSPGNPTPGDSGGGGEGDCLDVIWTIDVDTIDHEIRVESECPVTDVKIPNDSSTDFTW